MNSSLEKRTFAVFGVALAVLVALGVATHLHAGRLTAGREEIAGLRLLILAGSVAAVAMLGDRKSTRLNSSHGKLSRMPSSA